MKQVEPVLKITPEVADVFKALKGRGPGGGHRIISKGLAAVDDLIVIEMEGPAPAPRADTARVKRRHDISVRLAEMTGGSSVFATGVAA